MDPKVKLPEKYKLLCDYKKYVLAEKEIKVGNTSYNEYVTWKKDGTGVTLGHYFTDIKSAQSDFAVRSDMINMDRYLSRDELGLVYRALDVYRYSDIAQYTDIDIEKDTDTLVNKIGRIDGVKQSKYSEIIILVVEPHKEPYVDVSYDDWSTVHQAVSKYTQDIPINDYDDTVIIKNDLTNDMVLPENRMFEDNQLYGKCIIVNTTGSRYYSLNKNEIEMYKEQFSLKKGIDDKSKNTLDKVIGNIEQSSVGDKGDKKAER